MNIPPVKASPTKGLFLEALTSDLELEDAVHDLVDNSIDAAKRTTRIAKRNSYDGLYVKINFSKDKFQIHDNCGGIDLKTASEILFRLGRPAARKAEAGEVGRFGIGLKRAIFMMGKNASVESYTVNSHFTVPISVDAWKKNDDGDWDFKFDKYEENIKVGEEKIGTQIEVSNLYPGIAEGFAQSSFVEELVSNLQKKHKQALEKKLLIQVQGIKLISQPYTLKASEYVKPAVRQFDVKSPAGKKPVNVKLIAGVEESRPGESGWYVSCNGRFILVAEKTPKTGWGEVGDIKIPRMHHQFARFRGFAFFECDDPEMLPWNSSKTSVDLESPVYRKARRLMIETTRPIIDRLNDLDAESEADSRPLFDAISSADSKSVTALLAESTSDSDFSFEGRHDLNKPDRPLKISYTRPLNQVKKTREKLGVETNREVGEGTFDYFYEHEIR
jgi:hypothetical protein